MNDMRAAKKIYDNILSIAETITELTDAEKAEVMIEFLRNGGTKAKTATGTAEEVMQAFAGAVAAKERRSSLIKF